jgi:peptidoglycan/LPS O-acetylase OafA/YrhL
VCRCAAVRRQPPFGLDPLPVTHKVDNYRPEVDGLRAIAVMAVILYHAGLGLVPGGFIGVDIFFVISGFLITSIITREISGEKFSFITFYERRIRRIFPALFVVIAFSIPAAWVLLTPFQLKEFFQSTVATTLFASNIFFRIKSGYFSADAETIPLLHMWSLAVEEQFYIGFPVLLIVLHKIKRIPLNAALVAGCAGSLAYCIYKQPIEPMGAFFLLPSRAWELALGSLVAVNRVRILEALADKTMIMRIIEAGGLLMIAVPLVIYTNTTPFPGIATIPPVLGSAMLILASNGKGPVGAMLASRLFVGIGLISYSAYLWHQPLFAFTRAASVTHIPAWGAAILVVVTLVFAYLSWRFVEQPFRSRDGVSRASIYRLAIGLSALLIAVGMTGHVWQGFPGRYNAQVRALAATSIASPDRLRCHTDGVNYRKPAGACRYIGKTVDWALLGDSHSIETGYALAEHLAPSGHGVVHLSFSGCQPALTFETPNPGCQAWLKESLTLLETSPDIKNVFLVFRHSFYLFGDQTKTYPTVPDIIPNFAGDLTAQAARDAYWDDYTTLVNRLSKAGKRIYVVLPLPELPVHVDRYIYRDGGANAFTPVDYYMRRNAFVLSRMKSIRAIPGVSVLDPRDAVCDAGKCRAIINGESMYFDDNHFSMPAARRFIASQVDKGLLP